MRTTLIAAALAALPLPAWAWGPQGKNDAGCYVWDYDEVVDAGLEQLPDGGIIGPAGLCIQVTATTGAYLRKRVPPQFDAGELPDPGPYTGLGIPSWDAGSKPVNPFDPNGNGLPHPFLGLCSDGMGWGFETGTWEGWTPTGTLSSPRMGPVYGNNVHVERLHPPGYVKQSTGSGMDQTVGGDYWWFSRDVNQQGDYWVGSRDMRKDWTVFPGQTVAEVNTGAVYSPAFTIGTNYLDFWLGGGAHVSQRVELQLQPQGGWSQAALLAQYDGIGVSEFPQDWPTMTKLDGTWVVVRASSPMVQPGTGEDDFMGRHVGWNVAQFKFLTARLRILDAARPAGNGAELAHVNADQFRCTNTLDPKHTWLSSKVGQAVLEQPLWGTTDVHAHMTANMSFGGHLFWGDVADPIGSVYNCSGDLPAITLADGGVLRPAITNSNQKTDCNANVGFVILANMVGNAECVALSAATAAIPLVGPIAAAAEIATCTAAVAAATVGMLSEPLLTFHTLHGSLAPTGGGLDLGDWLEALAELITAFDDPPPSQLAVLPFHLQGVIESLDFDLPDGTHSGHFGRLHQQYQFQMVTRAWQGGLRLVVLDAHNGRAIQGLLDAKTDYDDWQAIRDMVITARRLTSCGDVTFKPGPLCNIAEIAKTPVHARRIIAQNKVAIILGTEVDELGKPRTTAMMTAFGRNGQCDSLQKQIDDLYSWGIRKITPIHGIDNPLGGTGLFNDVYVTAQQYHNLTRSSSPGVASSCVAPMDGDWVDWKPGSDWALPATFVDPLAGLVLATFTPGKRLAAHLGIPNNGLPVVDETTPTETTIGGYQDITFRLGFGDMRHPLTRFSGDYDLGNVHVQSSQWIPMRDWEEETTYDKWDRSRPKTLYRLNDLGWIVDGVAQCSLADVHLPLSIEVDEAIPASNNYHAAKHGHFNANGLTSDGHAFASLMMRKGMTFDLDHFSQRGRLDSYQDVSDFATQAGAANDAYATFGVHTNFRGIERSGPVPSEYRDQLGTGNETERTAIELDLVRSHGGVVSPALNATLVADQQGNSVNNNCDFSSKAWAQKYLAFMIQLKGRGLAVSTDMNGLTTPMASRYGNGACHTDNTFEDKWQSDVAMVQNWPRDFTFAANCTFNTKHPGNQWDASCPSTQMVAAQHQEASGVIYDDYATRPTTTLSTTPLIQRVLARGVNEVRDDNGPRRKRDELVTVGGSRQAAPLKKFKNGASGINTGWDINVDGLKHVGLYPDFFQDVRNDGITFEQMTPLFNAAEEYVRMWEKNCAMAVQWSSHNGGTPPMCAGTGEPWPSF